MPHWRNGKLPPEAESETGYEMTTHDNILRFPDVKAEREQYFDKLDSIGKCQLVLASCLEEMRELGANDEQIAKILKHAVGVLSHSD
jgi:hypothetical protein